MLIVLNVLFVGVRFIHSTDPIISLSGYEIGGLLQIFSIWKKMCTYHECCSDVYGIIAFNISFGTEAKKGNKRDQRP